VGKRKMSNRIFLYYYFFSLLYSQEKGRVGAQGKGKEQPVSFTPLFIYSVAERGREAFRRVSLIAFLVMGSQKGPSSDPSPFFLHESELEKPEKKKTGVPSPLLLLRDGTEGGRREKGMDRRLLVLSLDRAIVTGEDGKRDSERKGVTARSCSLMLSSCAGRRRKKAKKKGGGESVSGRVSSAPTKVNRGREVEKKKKGGDVTKRICLARSSGFAKERGGRETLKKKKDRGWDTYLSSQLVQKTKKKTKKNPPQKHPEENHRQKERPSRGPGYCLFSNSTPCVPLGGEGKGEEEAREEE